MLRRPSIHHFQRSSPKPLGQSKPNFMWSLLGSGEGTKVSLGHLGHMTKMSATPMYGEKPIKTLLLQNQRANDLVAWYVALVSCAHHNLFK